MMDWALATVSMACGAAVVWVFKRTADATAVRNAARQIVAHLLEFRLFFDEPALILRAQADLVTANLRLLRLVLWPAAAAGVPMALLMIPLDAVFGVRPLPVGEAAVVTSAVPRNDAESTLEAPSGMVVEAGPVRVFTERQVCWRVRPVRAVTGLLRVTVQGKKRERRVAAGARSLFLFAVENGVRVDYPRAPWMASFLLWSAVGAGVSAWVTSLRW